MLADSELLLLNRRREVAPDIASKSLRNINSIYQHFLFGRCGVSTSSQHCQAIRKVRADRSMGGIAQVNWYLNKVFIYLNAKYFFPGHHK